MEQNNNHFVDSLLKIKKLAKEVKVVDLLDPTSHMVMILTELISLAKDIPELERVEFGDQLNIDNIEADA
jgi:hypothetical protein